MVDVVMYFQNTEQWNLKRDLSKVKNLKNENLKRDLSKIPNIPFDIDDNASLRLVNNGSGSVVLKMRKVAVYTRETYLEHLENVDFDSFVPPWPLEN